MSDSQRPSHAESARTILARHRHGALSTIATRPEGHPYGSLVSYALTEFGDPIFVLSDLAEHTRNLKRKDTASLLVTDSLFGDDPLADGRVCVMGHAIPAPDHALPELRERVLSAHPEAQMYIDFKDFHIYQLHVQNVRYIGGFGRMSWVGLGDWNGSQADPLWDSAGAIIAHMNDDHSDALTLYAQHQGQMPEASSARMVGIDQWGCDLVVPSGPRPRRVRIAFETPITSAGAARKVLVQMVREAREALGIPHPG